MASRASSWSEPTFMKQRTKEIVLVSYKDAHRCPRAQILPPTIWAGGFRKRCTIAQGGVRDAPPRAPLVDVVEVPWWRIDHGGGCSMRSRPRADRDREVSSESVNPFLRL